MFPPATSSQRYPSRQRHRPSLVCLVFAAVAITCVCRPVPANAQRLSRLAISASNRLDPKAALASIDRCGGPDASSLVAPVQVVDFRAPGPASAAAQAVPPLAELWPAGRTVLLHLRVLVVERASGGREQESSIEARVADVVAALPTAIPQVRGAILEVDPSPQDLPLLQFTLAALVLRLKAVKPTLSVAVVLPPGLVTSEPALARRVTAYADAIGVGGGSDWRREAAWVREQLGKPVLLKLDAGEDSGAEASADAYLNAVVESGDTLLDTYWFADPTAAQAAGLCRSHAILAASLGPGFASAPVEKAPVSLRAEGDPLAATAFIDSASSSVAFLVRAGASRERPRTLTVAAGQDGGLDLACFDAFDGRRLPGQTVQDAGRTRAASCTADGPFAVMSVRRGDMAQRLYETVSVTGRGTLRVEEIVARWQQFKATQKHRLDNYMGECLLSLHFEPTVLGSGFDVSLQMRLFADRSGQRDWAQDAFFVNGVRFNSRRGFPLPQLEPEKVVSQPLDLALDEKYRYTLVGTDTVNGVLCYVVAIEPEESGDVLFSGKVWIDGVLFRQVRMQLQQSGGRSHIVSHVETQDYELIGADAGGPYNLLKSIYVQETLNAAGRSFLLEKTYAFSNYVVNSTEFDRLLAEVRASDRRMFRDTDDGLRVLRSEGGTRVVDPPVNRIRSIVVGALYEGSYDYPIPLAGLSTVNFDFRGTGAQLSVFFAGPILATNLSKQVSSRFRFGIDLALSAIPRSDRVFDGDVEASDQRMWVFEEGAGVLANWQATPGISFGASSHLTMNLFRPADETADDFSASGHGYTLLTAGEVKFMHRGFGLTANVLQGQRFDWSDLGYADGTGGTSNSRFTKYSGEFAKQFYVGPFSKLSLWTAYYGGDDLDRFSRYQPSFLARPRIRGIPGGVDAFDAVGVAGVQYGFDVMEVFKVEGLYNRAWAQNRDEGQSFRNYDGLELGLGTVGPWGTFIQSTVTYALRGNLDRYGSRWGLYLLVYRPLAK